MEIDDITSKKMFACSSSSRVSVFFLLLCALLLSVLSFLSSASALEATLPADGNAPLTFRGCESGVIEITGPNSSLANTIVRFFWDTAPEVGCTIRIRDITLRGVVIDTADVGRNNQSQLLREVTIERVTTSFIWIFDHFSAASLDDAVLDDNSRNNAGSLLLSHVTIDGRKIPRNFNATKNARARSIVAINVQPRKKFSLIKHLVVTSLMLVDFWYTDYGGLANSAMFIVESIIPTDSFNITQSVLTAPGLVLRFVFGYRFQANHPAGQFPTVQERLVVNISNNHIYRDLVRPRPTNMKIDDGQSTSLYHFIQIIDLSARDVFVCDNRIDFVAVGNAQGSTAISVDNVIATHGFVFRGNRITMEHSRATPTILLPSPITTCFSRILDCALLSADVLLIERNVAAVEGTVGNIFAVAPRQFVGRGQQRGGPMSAMIIRNNDWLFDARGTRGDPNPPGSYQVSIIVIRYAVVQVFLRTRAFMIVNNNLTLIAKNNNALDCDSQTFATFAAISSVVDMEISGEFVISGNTALLSLEGNPRFSLQFLQFFTILFGKRIDLSGTKIVSLCNNNVQFRGQATQALMFLFASSILPTSDEMTLNVSHNTIVMDVQLAAAAPFPSLCAAATYVPPSARSATSTGGLLATGIPAHVLIVGNRLLHAEQVNPNVDISLSIFTVAARTAPAPAGDAGSLERRVTVIGNSFKTFRSLSSLSSSPPSSAAQNVFLLYLGPFLAGAASPLSEIALVGNNLTARGSVVALAHIAYPGSSSSGVTINVKSSNNRVEAQVLAPAATATASEKSNVMSTVAQKRTIFDTTTVMLTEMIEAFKTWAPAPSRAAVISSDLSRLTDADHGQVVVRMASSGDTLTDYPATASSNNNNNYDMSKQNLCAICFTSASAVSFAGPLRIDNGRIDVTAGRSGCGGVTAMATFAAAVAAAQNSAVSGNNNNNNSLRQRLGVSIRNSTLTTLSGNRSAADKRPRPLPATALVSVANTVAVDLELIGSVICYDSDVSSFTALHTLDAKGAVALASATITANDTVCSVIYEHQKQQQQPRRLYLDAKTLNNYALSSTLKAAGAFSSASSSALVITATCSGVATKSTSKSLSQSETKLPVPYRAPAFVIVSNGLQGTNAVAAVFVSAIVPTLGFAVARQQAMMGLVQRAKTGNCAGIEEEAGVDAASSPTQVQIGTSVGRFFVGAAVMNTVLVLCLVLFAQAVGTLYLKVTHSSSWQKPMHVFARCHVAMVLYVTTSILMSPSLTMALVVLTVKDVATGHKVLAAVFALLLAAATVYHAVWALLVRERKEKYKKMIASATVVSERSPLQRFLVFWFEGPGEWVMPSGGNNQCSDKQHLQFDAAMPQFEGYSDRAFWFSLPEVGVQVALAVAAFIIQFVPQNKSCVTHAALQTVILAFYLFMCIWKRPFQELFLRIMVPVITVVQMVILVAVAAMVHSGLPTWIDSLVIFVSSLQSFMVLFTLLCALQPLATSALKAWRRFKSRIASRPQNARPKTWTLQDLLRDNNNDRGAAPQEASGSHNRRSRDRNADNDDDESGVELTPRHHHRRASEGGSSGPTAVHQGTGSATRHRHQSSHTHHPQRSERPLPSAAHHRQRESQYRHVEAPAPQHGGRAGSPHRPTRSPDRTGKHRNSSHPTRSSVQLSRPSSSAVAAASSSSLSSPDNKEASARNSHRRQFDARFGAI